VLSGLPKLSAVMTMPCVPVGVGMTCRSLLHSAALAGLSIEFFTSRYDEASVESFAIRAFTPTALARLPHRLSRRLSEYWLHASFLKDIEPGQIAYLWPSVPLWVYERLARRGIMIVAEAINTRMPVAKTILDEAYDRLGLPPAHGITEARIAEQSARYDLTDAIFAPSPATEEALAGSALAERFIPTSYGTWVPERLPQRPPSRGGRPVTFLFVGTAGVRKGIHLLLEAWKRAPANARLRIVGDVELPIRKLYGDVLNAPSVTCTGFQRDVGPEFRAADAFILPSLEEGDPIVTYEAASHGLPILASAMGAGRIGAETGCVQVVEPRDIDQLRERIAQLAFSDELRRELGARARRASANYDWSLVAPRRFARLAAFLRARGAS
jgi:glycosyltransferase involved in cell wall biosynthesis